MMTLIEKVNKVRGKVKFADIETVKKRYGICRECKFIMKLFRCKKCKCFMDFKTRIDMSKCPIGKW